MPKVVDRPSNAKGTAKRVKTRVECSQCRKRLAQVFLTHDARRGWDGPIDNIRCWRHGDSHFHYDWMEFRCPRCGHCWQGRDSNFVALIRAAIERRCPVRL